MRVMDINQLKLILESLNQTTELAAGVAVLWILISELGPLLLYGFLIYAVSRIVHRLVAYAFVDTQTVKMIRDSMNPRFAGTDLSSSEREAVLERLNLLKCAGFLDADVPNLSRKTAG